MDTRQERIGAETGGVPKALFSQTDDIEKKTIPGLSGKSFLNVTITKDLVSIVDHTDHKLKFEAERMGDGLRFDIRTKEDDGKGEKHHPDLFAKRLLVETLAFFERRNIPIRKIYTVWLAETDENGKPTSDNFVEFKKYMDDLSGNWENVEDLRNAALNTWTGKILTNVTPFTHIEGVEVHRQHTGEIDDITCTFTLPGKRDYDRT